MMVFVCCVCNKIKTERGWVRSQLPANELPSHGYCPECAEQARAELMSYLLARSMRQSRSLHSKVA